MGLFRFKTFIYFSSLAVLVVTISSCSLLQTKINSNERYQTDSGFAFKFPMIGEWYPAESKQGQYLVGKKPSEDGTTMLALVRHGPIWTPNGKAMSKSEMFNIFRKNIENEGQGGQVEGVKTTFSEKKHKGADCLFFDQIGKDRAPKGEMNLSNEGMICLHPQKEYKFIWMALSARSPVNAPVVNLSEEKKNFFDSLEFY